MGQDLAVEVLAVKVIEDFIVKKEQGDRLTSVTREFCKDEVYWVKEENGRYLISKCGQEICIGTSDRGINAKFILV